MELHPLNPWLRQEFGCILDGRPKFRIARKMREKRFLNENNQPFNEAVDNPFLKKIAELPKYEYIPDEIWILEYLRLGLHNGELVDSEKGTYETLYVFWWDTTGPKDYSYKEPEKKYVEFLIKVAILGPKETKQQMEAAAAADYAARRQKAYDVIDNASPYLPGQLHDGSGVVVPSSYKKEES